MRFLAADANLAAENILIGLPVLRHSGIDTKTMLEPDHARLDGSDCSVVFSPKNGGNNSRLMIACHDEVSDKSASTADKMQHRVDYFESKEE